MEIIFPSDDGSKDPETEDDKDAKNNENSFKSKRKGSNKIIHTTSQPFHPDIPQTSTPLPSEAYSSRTGTHYIVAPVESPSLYFNSINTMDKGGRSNKSADERRLSASAESGRSSNDSGRNGKKSKRRFSLAWYSFKTVDLSNSPKNTSFNRDDVINQPNTCCARRCCCSMFF